MPSFKLVRRRKRRRNMAGAVLRSRVSGKFVSHGGVKQASFSPWSVGKKKRKRKAKAKKTSSPRKRKGTRRHKARKASGYKFPTVRKNSGRRRRRRRSNPGYGIARRRRRRNKSHGLVRRRRRSNRGHAPVRRRRRRNFFGLLGPRRRRRRRNPSYRIRRHRRCRNPGGRLKRSVGGIMHTVKDIFSLGTAGDVLAGTFGVSAALWGPKLAGFGLWAPLGRGYGGVATSVVSSVLASWITGFVSPSRARVTLIGGLVTSFAGLISAIHCGWRTQLLPFETGLLACALPTVPTMNSAREAFVAQQVSMGVPRAAAEAIATAKGLAGYGGGNQPGVDRLLANEQAFRRSAGVNDFVPAPTGVSDYAQFGSSSSSSGMDSSAESF